MAFEPGISIFAITFKNPVEQMIKFRAVIHVLEMCDFMRHN